MVQPLLLQRMVVGNVLRLAGTGVALGAPLAYVAGGRGSETYIALRNGNVPGVDPVDKAVALQFRRGQRDIESGYVQFEIVHVVGSRYRHDVITLGE